MSEPEREGGAAGAVRELDVAIIGGGPAGMAAAVYAGRARVRALVIDAMGGGGQMLMMDHIENYPGLTRDLSGADLAGVMRAQVERFGVPIVFDQVQRLEPAADRVLVVGSSATYAARTVLVATGARHRELCIPGEAEFLGRGVSYCAVCDGAFFRRQHVVVVGGGDTAIKEALYLARICDRVTVVHRRDRLRAERVMQERAMATPNIDFVWDSKPEAVLGEARVTGLRVRHQKTGEARELPVTGIFIFVGILPAAEFLGGTVRTDEAGFLPTDVRMRTSQPRVFAAGDIRSQSVRQVGSAVGDGITAIITMLELLDTETPPRDLATTCAL